MSQHHNYGSIIDSELEYSKEMRVAMQTTKNKRANSIWEYLAGNLFLQIAERTTIFSTPASIPPKGHHFVPTVKELA